MLFKWLGMHIFYGVVLGLGYLVSDLYFTSIATISTWSRLSDTTERIVEFSLLGAIIVMFYVSMVLRVHELFKNNAMYQLSQSNLICLFLLALLFCGFWFTFTATKSWQFGAIVEMLLWTAAYICDVAINTTILILFLKRLYQMLKHLNVRLNKLMVDVEMESITNEMVLEIDNNNTDNLVKSESLQQRITGNETEKNEIVNLMVKISLLTIVSQILQQIWIFAEIYYNVVLMETGRDVYSFNSIARLCKNIWVVTSCTALYLAFIFNEQQYYFCCKSCHNCIQNNCIKCIYYNKMQRYN